MRTKKTTLNFLTSFIPWIILGILGFFKIKYFILIFGPELNGLVQLAFQVFTFLSILALGFPAAIRYHLYEPLIKEESKKINSILTGSKHIFRKIGFVIFLGGILFSLILPYVVYELDFPKIFVFALFFLYSVDYLTQYILLLPYKVLLEADQRSYIINIILNTKHILFRLLELFLILMKVNYLLILLISVVSNIIVILFIVRRTKKIYKWLNLSEEPDNTPLKMTKDVLYHKVNSFVFHNIDIFLVSFFKGLTSVSIYGAYNYIVMHLTTLTTHIFKAPQASIANFIKSKTCLGEKRQLIEQYWIMLFMFTAATVPVFISGISEFITLWIDKSYVLSYISIILFGLVLWMKMINRALYYLIETGGLFAETKRAALLASVTNVLFSIILINKYGIAGVLFATFVTSFILTIKFASAYYNKILESGTMIYFTKTFLNLVYISMVVGLLYISNPYLAVGSMYAWFLKYGMIFLGNGIVILTLNYLFVSEFNNIIKKFIPLLKMRKK